MGYAFFSCDWLTTVCGLVGMIGLVLVSCWALLLQWLPAHGRQGKVTKWLVTGSWVGPQGLVLAYWRVELVSKIGGNGIGRARSHVSLVLGRANSHTPGCSIGVPCRCKSANGQNWILRIVEPKITPELVFSCWWMRLRPGVLEADQPASGSG